MYAQLTGFSKTPISPHGEALQALRATPTDTGLPHLLGYGPVARLNPYQSLLYQGFADRGIAVAPVFEPIRVRELLGLKPLVRGMSLHLHWMSWLTGEAPTAAKARSVGMGYLGRLRQFRDRGGSVVWTVHNVYPHDSRFVDEDLEIQQELADLVDVVHLMSPAVLEAMDGLTSIDQSKVVHAPHPSYAGAYEDFVSRSEARATLGIDSDEVVFVLFGALKAYKGVDTLLQGFDRLVERHGRQTKFRLLIAGQPDADPDVQAAVHTALRHPSVLIDPSRVPGNRAQYFLRAADVGLATYDRSLNSGAALLYQTFGLPVVATQTPVFTETLPPEIAEFVPQGADGDSLADTLARSVRLVGPETTERVLEAVAPLHPGIVSRRFADELLERLR